MPSLTNIRYGQRIEMEHMAQNKIIGAHDETFTTKNKFGGTINYAPAELKYGEQVKVLPTSIIGSPMEFSPISDPNSRVYCKMFLEDLSIIKIHPGLPMFNKKLKLSNLTRVLDTLENASDGILPSISSGDDIRFIKFKHSVDEYEKYCVTVLSFLRGIMSSTGKIDSGGFSLSDALGIKDTELTKHGYCFFCNRATTASETFDNSYGPSNIANTANQKSAEMRELRQMRGMIAGNTGLFGAIAKQITEIASGIIESIPVFGDLLSGFARVLEGSQLYFPDIWNDSTMGRDYTVSIKLYSPAGDSESIWRNILAPLVALMCLALPRADGIYGYTEPFLVKVCVPGWFQSDCAAITSLEVKKGGDDNLWTMRGYPNEVEVNLTIKDLYPQMSMSKTNANFKFNKGLINYLECMAGLDPTEVDGWNEGQAFKNVRNRRKNYTYENSIENKVDDVYYNNWKPFGDNIKSYVGSYFG